MPPPTIAELQVLNPSLASRLNGRGDAFTKLQASSPKAQAPPSARGAEQQEKAKEDKSDSRGREKQSESRSEAEDSTSS